MGVVQYLHNRAEMEYEIMYSFPKEHPEYALHHAVANAYQDAFMAVNRELHELDVYFNKKINEMSDFKI